MKKSFLLIALVLSLAVLFGCASSIGRKSESTADMAVPPMEPGAGHDTDWTSNAGSKGDAPSGESANPIGGLVVDPARKMIWTGEISFETTEFDSAVEALYDLISECGGFVQSSTITGEGRNTRGEPRLRSARYTIRIPSENFQLFMQSSGNVATVITSSTNAQDVTSEYIDTEARLRVLEIKEERLLEMLEKTSSVEYKDELQYILQLENELANVRYDIETLTGTLRKYDELISYSTINVYMREVLDYTATPARPESVRERIATKFNATLKRVITTCEDIVVWIIGSSPVLIMLALIGAAVFAIARITIRRKQKRRAASPRTDDTENK